LGGVSTGDGRPARRELGAGGLPGLADGRLLLLLAARLLGGRALAPLLAERVVAVGLSPGVSAAAVNFGRLGARAGFRLLGGRWLAAPRLLGGGCALARPFEDF
jgi:hypothetical protein